MTDVDHARLLKKWPVTHKLGLLDFFTLRTFSIGTFLREIAFDGTNI